MKLNCNFEYNQVGQGLFYWGELEGRDFNFTFVYDCGTSSKMKFLRDEISRIQKEIIYKKSKIDLLVISHFDGDHVNGLKDLFLNTKIDTVIIPYLRPIERLKIAARNPKEPKDYYLFLHDPVKYLISKNVKKIILIGNKKRSDEELFPEEVTTYNIDKEEILLDKLVKDEDLYAIVSNEEPELITDDRVECKCHNGYMCAVKEGRAFWLFRFFNYNIDDEAVDRFEMCIKSKKIDLSNNEKIKDVIKDIGPRTKIGRDLNQCYKKIGDINDTSIVMYHGPLGRPIIHSRTNIKYEYLFHGPERSYLYTIRNLLSYPFRFYRYNEEIEIFLHEEVLGTLLLGDIDLNRDLDSILIHFKNCINKIRIALVPHHGSIHSWKSDILKHLKQEVLWVYSAGIKNKHQHPDECVIRDFEFRFAPRILIWNNENNNVTFISYIEWT